MRQIPGPADQGQRHGEDQPGDREGGGVHQVRHRQHRDGDGRAEQRAGGSDPAPREAQR